MLVVKWLMIQSLLLLTFDLVCFFIASPETGRLLESPLWLNDVVFSMVRVMAYLAWAAPIFYLFWPQIVARGKRGSRDTSLLNKRKVAGNTLPSGMLSGYLDDELYGAATYLKQESGVDNKNKLLIKKKGGTDDSLKRARGQNKGAQSGKRKQLPPEMDHPVGSVSLHEPQSHISNMINQTYQVDGQTYASDSSKSSDDDDNNNSF